CLQHDNFPL
nr:immunoglobulin light chain junction region [Homo sapiens]